MIFGLNLVGLCLGFSFPLASSASLAWIVGLGFPAVLQTPYDLGCGISLLNFSTFEAVLASFLNHLLPCSPLLPSREETQHHKTVRARTSPSARLPGNKSLLPVRRGVISIHTERSPPGSKDTAV